MQHPQIMLDASKKQIRQRAFESSPHVLKGHRTYLIFPGLSTTANQLFTHIVAIVLVGTLSGCTGSPLQDGVPTIDRDETWEAHYLNGTKTGYSVSRSDIVIENSRRLVRTTKRVVQGIRRFGDVTNQELQYESLETTNGELVNCQWSLTNGSNVMSSTLTAHDDYLDIALESTGSRQDSPLVQSLQNMCNRFIYFTLRTKY